MSRDRACPTRTISTLAVLGSARQRRSFEFFVHQIGKDLSDALRLDNLRQLMLQLSFTDPSIKKAVIALGSIGERLQINSILNRDSQQANACHEFALKEYSMSLKHLRQQIRSQPDRPKIQTLIACFLFTVFEFLQGGETNCLIHLRSGLDIFHGMVTLPTEGSIQLEAAADLTTRNIVLSLPDHVLWKNDSLLVELLQTFHLLETQALDWLGLESWETPLLVAPAILRPKPKHLNYFPTIEDATNALNWQIGEVHGFRRSLVTPSFMKPFDILQLRQCELITQLRHWLIASEDLRDRLGSGCNEDTLLRLDLMKMNYCATLIMLESPSDQRHEDVPRSFLAEFSSIVYLAKSILLPLNEHRLTRIHQVVLANNRMVPDATFSFYSGIIQPLYLTVVKCPDAGIASEAIHLLSSSPWREGASESSAMARIASNIRKGYREWSEFS